MKQLRNCQLAAELSASCGIRAVSAAKLQNLIWTRYNVLKTTTKHNQTILDNLNLSKQLSFIFSFFFSFFFFIESIEMFEVYFVSYFFFLTILFLILQITQSAGGEHTQELLFCLFYLTILFLILQITQSARGEHTQELLIFFQM